ncbi:ABC transporter permease [Streptomyces sp. Z26]|uniref:ABC transporter permease n=1 Tax=Streptomyces TaxID=1883 RepID=UPI000EF15F6E|nr:ABC transporter permease [Streptomyces sp. Z26]RLL70611.1 ABC transporter permease [Streptomyces sp. Z26]
MSASTPPTIDPGVNSGSIQAGTGATPPVATVASYPTTPGRFPREAMVCARRQIIKMFRLPELMAFNLLQPLLFILLFAYVFAGAIGGGAEGRDDYREFMMAGFFAQCILFATVSSSATNIAQDMHKGMMDRFRSLPMTRGAVLTGRTIADFVQNVMMLLMMIVMALIVGWRIHEGFLKALAGFGVILFLAYSFSWVGAAIGTMVRTPEAAAGVVVILFPLTMLSNALVPPSTLPRVLQHVVNWNPYSATVQSARELFGNEAPASDSWPMQNATLASLGWSVLIILVFRTIAVRRYRGVSR